MATSNESAPDTVRDDNLVAADTDPDLDLAFDRIEAEPVRTPARERLRTLRGIGPRPADEDEDEDAVPATMPVVTFESLAEPEQPTLPDLAKPTPSTPPPPPPHATAQPQAPPPASATPPATTPPPPRTLPLPRTPLPPLQAAPAPRAALPPPLLPAPAPRIELPSIPPLRPPPTPKARGGVASAAAVYRAIAASRPPPKAPAPEAAATVAPIAGGSVAPVALATVPPPAPPDERPPKGRRSRRKVAAVGVISGALAALGGFWSLRNVERAGVAGLHAVAEDGSAVHDVRILVDGVERCASSPCTLTGLARGSHLASAVASGYVPTAARAFTVQAGEPANVSFELVRVQPPEERVAAATEPPSPAAAAKPLAEAHAAGEATPPEESSAAADVAERAAISPKRAATPKAQQSPAPKLARPAAANVKAATGQATLSFQSAPRANVVLDGRPIGKTPLASVSVKAGTHSIVFIGADGRRKAQLANVTPGSKRAIVAKF